MSYVKPGSQYDAGVVSIVSVTEKVFFTSQIASLMLIFFDSLIGWTLANACDATLK